MFKRDRNAVLQPRQWQLDWINSSRTGTANWACTTEVVFTAVLWAAKKRQLIFDD